MEAMHGDNEVCVETYRDEIGEAVQSWYIPVKSVFDFIMALIIGIITLPVVIVTIVAIKIESKGPVFYHQVRVGLMGKHITVTKLRSMRMDAEENGARWADKNDSRITKVGKLIRKTRIDELPQLWNVLRGDMSLIGPRPERPEFTEEFSHEYPGFEQRLRIKPGLSGYAQVHGGYNIDPGQKAKLDSYYIDNFGITMDSRIFLDTVRTVVTGEGAR
ncbi:capsular polysaccharide biosynthesis protein [Paucilactobacillus hokkaidonensis JCM 18461]|uniref:Capsular polysaccharide biosynthesis protein n=2 Tax=Paucilactobacillus hokkaidonensis TaxID=1193095 RepID=A0A0A1GWP0_9LACO|nr:sugar transferase [Paucilactobacillus hokkaidonensis]KRO08796.1 priming glycosyltransferase, polyprenyl glycosylphosphotransferase [Paucilactobacillus hokkaidonensis]BAP84816.1 capsular polysaccharide biosynthesis protein [Paucilactobacillus hokkaidonensis JCM 18461]